MRILRATLIILFTAAGAHAQNPKLTDAQRAQITAAVQKVVDEVYAGARETNFDRISAHSSKEDGDEGEPRPLPGRQGQPSTLCEFHGIRARRRSVEIPLRTAGSLAYRAGR